MMAQIANTNHIQRFALNDIQHARMKKNIMCHAALNPNTSRKSGNDKYQLYDFLAIAALLLIIPMNIAAYSADIQNAKKRYISEQYLAFQYENDNTYYDYRTQSLKYDRSQQRALYPG